MVDLQTYNEKRDFNKTNEPKGVRSQREGRVFCVQEHFSRHHHFDFRLELDGALKSWAVPKGPSLSPSQKRLAVHVEDHPIDYADFEGVIPQGEYGAGEVILWDKGEWVPLKDPQQGHKDGRIEFELKGEKLKGKWALIRMKGKDEKNWLLIKMKDEFTSDKDITKERPESVAKKELKKIDPQLATTMKRAPRGEDYIREIKHDGYRTLVSYRRPHGLVYSRNGQDWTKKLSFILEAIKSAQVNEVVLDGETVLLDTNGVSSFSKLQRALRSKDSKNLSYYAFDILSLNGEDLRHLPQIKRKKILQEVIKEINSDRVLYSEHFEEEGQNFFEKMEEFGLEGMMSKKKSAPYLSGRNKSWIKTKCFKTEPFVVIGHTFQKDSKVTLGSLLVARKNEIGAIEVGKVGTGFSKKESNRILNLLKKESSPPNMVKIPQSYKTSDIQFCAPDMIVQIKFSEVTSTGSLRHPIFEGEREDLEPGQVLSWETPDEMIKKIITTPTRELWPGVTKRDYGRYLLKYQNQIRPWLYGRPLTLFKCPKGVLEEEGFFSKHKGNMHGLKEIKIPVQDAEKEFYEVRDEKGLLYIARYSGVEFHIWNSTSKDPWIAQELVLDLDPGEGVSEETLINAAFKIKRMLEALDLTSFPKTTGKKGIHLHLPLKPKYSVDQVYQLAKSIAYILEEELPDLFTSSSRFEHRSNKIFIDYMRNSFGATFIAPFSPRAVKEAPIALPLTWKDLEDRIDLPKATIKDALKARIKSSWEDYWSFAQEVELFEKL